MHVDIDDLTDKEFDLSLGLRPEEIDAIISDLKELRNSTDPHQHFHISSNFDGKCRLRELTFYLKSREESEDIQILSRAYAPGDTIKLPSETLFFRLKQLFKKLFSA
jgi:hypothetical protein